MRAANGSSSGILIAKAAAKALGILAVGYILLVHLYVVWKWDMDYSNDALAVADTTATANEILIENEVNETAEEEPVVPELPPWYESAEFLKQQQLLQHAISTMEKRLSDVTTRRQKVLELTRRVAALRLEKDQQRQAEEAERAAEAEPLPFFAAQQEQSSYDKNNNKHHHVPQHLQELVEMGFAAYPTEAALKQAVRLAVQDLQRNIQLSHEVDWRALGPALPTTLSEPEVIVIPATSASSNESDAMTGGCSETDLTMADLEAHEEQVRLKLRQRWHHPSQLTLPVSFAPTLERLEAARKERFQQYVQEALAVVAATKAVEPVIDTGNDDGEDDDDEYDDDDDDSNENNARNCIQAEQVVPWVKAGLGAMYRQQDIRDALLQEMEQDGLDTRGIILDAPLESPLFVGSGRRPGRGRHGHRHSATAAKPKQPRAPTQSLRQALDSPLLTKHVSEWINVVLDVVSGYHDQLDEFLDDTFGTDNVGKEAVGKLLKAAGGVQLPEVVREQWQERVES